MAKISVIIPTYNCAKYLPETIDSVLAQSFQDFEIIIVDDGSMDNTKEVLCKYINKYNGRIKYLYQNNSGQATARNKGILASKGEYIAFLDSDDVWHGDKLELQIKYFEKYPELSMVHSEFEYINPEGKTLGFSDRRKKMPYDGMILKEFFNHPLILPSSMLVRKEVFNEIGLFDENVLFVEDTDLLLRMVKLFKVGLMDKPLVKYRLHNVSTTRDMSKQVKRQEERLEVFRKFLKSNRDFAENNKDQVNKSFSKTYYDYIEALLQCNDFSKAKNNLEDYYKHSGLSIGYLILYLKVNFMNCLGAETIKYFRRLKRGIWNN